MIKLGPTGRYPNGKLGEGDGGELRIAMWRDDERKLVVIHFGVPITWTALTPNQAIETAKALAKHAGATRVEIELP